MASWLLVWLVVGLVSTTAVLVCLLGLVRHVLILGRTVKQLQDEVQPIAEDLSRQGQRAGERTASIGGRRLGGSSRGGQG
ncbi:MAG: hypothetical protein ACXVWF_07390 [Actinomycetota bacterium]